MFENYVWWRHKLVFLDLFSNKSTVFYNFNALLMKVGKLNIEKCRLLEYDI